MAARVQRAPAMRMIGWILRVGLSGSDTLRLNRREPGGAKRNSQGLGMYARKLVECISECMSMLADGLHVNTQVSTPQESKMLKQFIAVMLAFASNQADAVFYSGNDLVRWMREFDKSHIADSQANYADVHYYMAYVTAVHDMYDFGGIISPSRHVTVGQVSEVVGSYLKANPIEWDSPAAILVRDGLVAAFSCR
jgi:hypothetical protein